MGPCSNFRTCGAATAAVSGTVSGDMFWGIKLSSQCKPYRTLGCFALSPRSTSPALPAPALFSSLHSCSPGGSQINLGNIGGVLHGAEGVPERVFWTLIHSPQNITAISQWPIKLQGLLNCSWKSKAWFFSCSKVNQKWRYSSYRIDPTYCTMFMNFAQVPHFILCLLTPVQNFHGRRDVMLYSLLPSSMVKMFQRACYRPNMNYAVVLSDQTPSACEEVSGLEWLI